jgi:hypothetical protein
VGASPQVGGSGGSGWVSISFPPGTLFK